MKFNANKVAQEKMNAPIVQPYNPQPDIKVYAKTRHGIDREGVGYLITKIEYPETGGIYIHYKDVPYPRKGFPTMQMCESLNIIKKITMLVFSNPLLLLSKKNVDKYLNLTDWVMDNPYKAYMKDDRSDWYEDRYYCVFAKEFRKLLEVFLSEIGIDTRMARVFAHIMQDDDAYRYRVQDVFSETTLEKLLDNPRKELGRLMKLSTSREMRPTYDLLNWLLQTDESFRKQPNSVDADSILIRSFKVLLDPAHPASKQVNTFFEQSSLEALEKNPRKEIEKLKKIAYQQEGTPVSNKTMMFAKLLSWTLIVPKYKKAFKKALSSVDFKKLQFEDDDRYFAMRPGYKFMGMTIPQMEAVMTQIHKGVIPFVTITK